MLGKLIKYEFKASSRLFLLLYAALILVSIINLVLEPIRDQSGSNPAVNAIVGLITGIFVFSYVILVAAVIIVTIVVIIIRFYKNLLGDEGYLMFTLPVNTDSQILSKLITSMVWSILSFLAVIASLLILSFRIGFFEKITDFFRLANEAGINIGAWSAGMIFTVLIYAACTILMFYTAMAIGSNLTKNRLLGSFLGYIILYAITQVVGLLSMLAIYGIGDFSKLEQYNSNMTDPTQSIEFINTIGFQIFLYINILNILMIVGYYLVTRYFIKNKLNLA